MRNPENALNSLTTHSKDKNYHYERLYRLLFNPEMFYVAYQKIYANEGNMTKGTDNQNIDSMSLARIEKLINSLKDESYQPKPCRRVNIPKKNGKTRPLGIPSFDDKLVQEVLRMILQAIYEGYFEPTSHGFRPKRSCHTALIQIQKKFTGVKWFVEGDIKGFFDNINHNTLISILTKRIKDDRFLRLIRKFLKVGYVEDWQFHKTYSGTPQGGIISPILANIYLDQFDKFIREYAKSFNKGKERARNPEYRKFEVKLRNIRKLLEKAKDETEKQNLIKKIRSIEKERVTVPYAIAMDKDFKRLQYVRYADDFLIGIIGSNSDCAKVKSDIHKFLSEKLQLELSQEKTLITHANKPAKFLGYDVSVRKCNQPKRDALGRLKRDYGGRIVLKVTTETIRARLQDYQAIKIMCVNGKEVWKPKGRYYMKDSDDLEILKKYNAEIRGFYNYYSIANNSGVLHHFKYLMEYSMYKTYCTKYRTIIKKLLAKYRIGKDFCVKYKTKNGKENVAVFYNEGFKRKTTALTENLDEISSPKYYKGRTSLISRLKAEKCEYCGATSTLEMHHIRKLKNLKGKSDWEQLMISRQRKTIAVCHECHVKIHNGKLN
jgi:group II intron reverse transcriptase/maturase